MEARPARWRIFWPTGSRSCNAIIGSQPDLVPVALTDAQVAEWKTQLPELPKVRRARMIADYGITEYDAGVLADQKDYADYFEVAAKAAGAKLAKTVCNLFMTEVLALVGKSGKALAEAKLTPAALAALVKLVNAGTINGPTVKELLPELFETGGDPEAIVKARGLGQVSDEGALAGFVDQAIAANPKSVADFKAGKKAAAGFFVGQVMKLSHGKADPKLIGKMVAERLAKM